MYKLSYIILFITISSFSQNKSNLTVSFDNIKSNSGNLYVALYNAENQFLKKEIKGSIVKIINGEATVIFNELDFGEYAISSFFDKNNNGKLDTNFLGIPKEPIAFSNNAKSTFGPPKFKNTKFVFNANNTHIKINF